MKKFFFFMLGISFLASCSRDAESVNYNDASVANPKNFTLNDETIDPVLKDLYVRMINSQSFIDFENALIVFNDKIGEEIPESEINSISTVLSWVSTNLSKTGFQSYNEAVDEWENVIRLCSISNKANYSFTEYLAGATPGSLIPILNELEPVPTSCPTCTAQYNSCVNSAQSAYTTAVEKAANSLRAGDTNSGQYDHACGEARMTKNKAVKLCTSKYNVCCIGG